MVPQSGSARIRSQALTTGALFAVARLGLLPADPPLPGCAATRRTAALDAAAAHQVVVLDACAA
jgi:hypothetical protein